MNPFILPASLSPVKAVVSVLCKVKFRCCGEEKPEKEVQWLFSSHLNDRNNARLLTMAKGFCHFRVLSILFRQYAVR